MPIAIVARFYGNENLVFMIITLDQLNMNTPCTNVYLLADWHHNIVKAFDESVLR